MLAGNSLSSCPDSRSQEKPTLVASIQIALIYDICNECVCNKCHQIFTRYILVLEYLAPQQVSKQLATTIQHYVLAVWPSQCPLSLTQCPLAPSGSTLLDVINNERKRDVSDHGLRPRNQQRQPNYILVRMTENKDLFDRRHNPSNRHCIQMF